jgi:glucokinase
MARESIKTGKYPAYFTENTSEISARAIAEAADAGDETALEVYRTSGRYLGRGLAVMIDILNPETIVIGSVFARSGHLLRESMEEEIKKEALPMSMGVCKIVAAELGESIGDFAAIAAVFM